MADITDSRKKGGKNLMEAFQKLVNTTNDNLKEVLLSPLTITLGDEFQGIARDLSGAVAIIIHLEEHHIFNEIDFKLRYVIHCGEVDTDVNPASAHAMLGEGFIIAREMLDLLKKNKNSRFKIKTENSGADKVINAAFELYTTLLDSWKISDFKLIADFLKFRDYKEVAALTGKTRSQIWKREKTLRITDYFAIKEILQETTK